MIEEAWITIPHERDWDATSTFFDKVKFAELIIKECAAVANYHSDGHENDQFGRKLFHYTVDVGEEITDYFGLE
jgi:hypothetical protein